MKLKTNYFVDLALLLSALACAATGVLKLPELALDLEAGLYDSLSWLHDWSGVAMVLLTLVHLLLHAKWINHATRQIFGLRKAPGRRIAQPARIAAPLQDQTATGMATGVQTGTPDAGAVAIQESSAGRRAPVTRQVPAGRLAGLLVLAGLGLLLPGGSGQLAAGSRGGHSPSLPAGISYQAGSLKDGIWTGEATGYMPALKVAVTVQNGKISQVAITGHQETPRWFNRVVNVIPQAIVAAQGTAIDAVGGATCSSYGIMAAVEQALAAARK